MKKSLFLAGSIAGLAAFSGIAQSDNEATYSPNTRSLHIPKVAADGYFYDVNFQQGDGLNFLMTSIIPSASSASANIATYNSAKRSLSIPMVMIGNDVYSANMQQGQGLNFSVTSTLLVNSYFEPIDVFALNNHLTGGNRSTSVSTSTGEFGGGGQGCGYSYPQSRAETEQKLQQSGGSVTLSTLTEWCGSAAGETVCIKGFGKLLVVTEPWSSERRITTLYMTELVANHWTEVEFDNLAFNPFGKDKPSTKISAVNSDVSVPEGAECNYSSLPAQSKEFINGQWVGYKATYSLSTMVGSTSAATASCSNQVCTVNSSSDVTSVKLSNFNLFSRSGVSSSGGAWATASGAPKLAGATMTGDRQLLSMFVCNTPLDEAKTFDNCSFFTFKR